MQASTSSQNLVTIDNWRYPFSYAQIDHLYWMFCGFINAKGGQVLIREVALTPYKRDEFERELGYSLCDFIPCISESNTKKYVSVLFERIAEEQESFNIMISIKNGDPKKYYTRSRQPYTKISVYLRSGAQIIGVPFHLDRLQRRENTNEERKAEKSSEKKVVPYNKYGLQNAPKIKDLGGKIKENNEVLKRLVSELLKQKNAGNLQLRDRVDQVRDIALMLHRIQDLSMEVNSHYQMRLFNNANKGFEYLLP